MSAFLDRLDRVSNRGGGQLMAKCPAHDDRSPSLAVKVCDNGATLVHCFAGCDIEDILAAVGLTFQDLMPGSISNHRMKSQRWINARDALASLDHESLVVAIIGDDFIKTRSIEEDCWERLAKAVNRINHTRAEWARCRK